MRGAASESSAAAFGDPQPLSRSPLWQWQRDYFAGRGLRAWREGEVPSYAAGNPVMANAYAEILLAFRRDLARRQPGEEALHICEIGGGSGRFAFHCLRRLAELCDEAGIARSAFRYILTDIVPANLDFWRAHPCFQPYLEAGMLDVARFDLTRPAGLALELSGDTLGEGALRGPLAIIANYLFDSVPQDLFHFRNGSYRECRASLAFAGDSGTVDSAELLAGLKIDFDDGGPARPVYPEPELQELLDEYRQALAGTYLPFPAPALRGLRSLSRLSEQGFLLLSADIGEHRLARLDGRGPPQIARHGSISMAVNYHAFTRSCEKAGGLPLTPPRGHDNINVIALLTVADAESFGETRSAYRRCIAEFGPDDFTTVARHARGAITDLSGADILAYLRLGRHDSHLFGHFLPRLIELAPGFDDATRAELREAADAVWDRYFPLGEELDLADATAALLYAMNDFDGALAYFERSAAIYGQDGGTLYNMACCLHLLGRDGEAAAALDQVLRNDPGNAEARTLLSFCEPAVRDGAE